jgi:hypothetical protein
MCHKESWIERLMHLFASIRWSGWVSPPTATKKGVFLNSSDAHDLPEFPAPVAYLDEGKPASKSWGTYYVFITLPQGPYL